MRIPPALLSTLRSVPISYFIYSSLSFVGRHSGGELPGMWFVAALQDAGRDLAAVRQTLYRMEKEGELMTRKVGRAKLYSATTFANAEIDAGLQKIFQPRAADWDGRWTIVHVNLRAPTQRVTRERVVALLAVEGFALAGVDFYIHPRDVGGRVAAALSAAARPHVLILRGHLDDTAPVQSILAMWQIPELAQRYGRVLAVLRELDSAIRLRVSDEDAFLLRYALVFSFLSVAWDDPGLPAKALPDDWPGEKARRLAARLYRRLEGPALRHAHRLLARSAPPSELIASGSSI